jgi:hypothetical protein
MKQFIKEKLNILLEQNILEQNAFSTMNDYYNVWAKVEKARAMYGGDEYWENAEDGQWVGNITVGTTGNLRISTNLAKAGDVVKHKLGIVSTNQTGDYFTVSIKAGRGIDHNDTRPNLQPARTRLGLGSNEINDESFTIKLPDGVLLPNGDNMISFNLPKPGSPASDAQIKAYVIYGAEMIDMVKRNLKGHNSASIPDARSKEFANQTAPEARYKVDKLAAEKQRAANKFANQKARQQLTLSPEEREQQRQANANKPT